MAMNHCRTDLASSSLNRFPEGHSVAITIHSITGALGSAGDFFFCPRLARWLEVSRDMTQTRPTEEITMYGLLVCAMLVAQQQ
jgi:hypothetical protein